MRKLPLMFIPILAILFYGQTLFAEIVDRVVAVVNDEVITQSEVDILLRPWFEQMRTQIKGEDLAVKLNEARRNLLNQLIEDKLVYQEAKKRKIEILENELEERVLEFKRRFKNEEDFNKMIVAQGLTETKLKEKYRQQLAIRRLHIMEIKNKILVSPKEIEDFYTAHEKEFNQPEKIKLRSITVRKAPDKQGKKDEEAKLKSEQILADLKKNADFAKIAEAHSEDYNAPSGGDLGYVGRGEMARDIDQVIFALNPGDISPIIETEIGYHIFKVDEKQEGKKKNLDEVRLEIQEIIYRDKAKKRFDEWMRDLKEKAYISIR